MKHSAAGGKNQPKGDERKENDRRYDTKEKASDLGMVVDARQRADHDHHSQQKGVLKKFLEGGLNNLPGLE